MWRSKTPLQQPVAIANSQAAKLSLGSDSFGFLLSVLLAFDPALF
jgi:hypothetical protein